MMRASPAAWAGWLAMLSCLCLPVSRAASPDASRAIACAGANRDMRAYAKRETPPDIAKTTDPAMQLGSTCRNRMRKRPKPSERAATTKSLFLSTNTWTRTSRA